MNRQETVRKIALVMPANLRRLRSKLMFETVCESLGVEEVACPGCNASGWLDADLLERCPVCCGFQEVPEALADWLKAKLWRAAQEAAAVEAVERSLPWYGQAAAAAEPARPDAVPKTCPPFALVEY